MLRSSFKHNQNESEKQMANNVIRLMTKHTGKCHWKKKVQVDDTDSPIDMKVTACLISSTSFSTVVTDTGTKA